MQYNENFALSDISWKIIRERLGYRNESSQISSKAYPLKLVDMFNLIYFNRKSITLIYKARILNELGNK